MLKINARNLVNSEQFVREPVDKEVNSILNSSSTKIILTGGKGVGKSTVLCSLENRGLGCNEQTIYDSPEPTITLAKEPNDIFDGRVFDYLSELRFTNNILFYIKRNYPIVFQKHFERDMELVHYLLKKLYEQANDPGLGGATIECKYRIKEISFDVLSRFRQIMEIDKLNIAIDKFDKINGSSEYIQKTYEKFFDMFDRVIITSDDPSLDNERLLDKGYNLISITYGNDKDVLREIIRRRESLWEGSQTCEELFLDDIFLDRLIELNSNIDFAIEVIRYLNSFLVFYGNNYNIENELEKVIEEKKERSKSLERIISKPTLYL